MKCENCGRETDIIKHVKLINSDAKADYFVCVACYNNRPKFYVKEIEEIRND